MTNLPDEERTKYNRKKCYVYILQCSDSTLYTGWTANLEKRLHNHNTGKGAKYTRGRLPVKLIYTEIFEDPGSAMRREAEIKKMTRHEKLLLSLTLSNN